MRRPKHSSFRPASCLNIQRRGGKEFEGINHYDEEPVLLDIGEMKDKARSAVLSCRVATVEEAYANILSGSGRFNYYRNRSESLGRGNVVGKTATSLRSADPHLCRVSSRRPR